MTTQETTLRPAVLDLSLLIVLASNIISIFLAITQNWSMGEILWVYWAQSVIIGIINVIRMMSLKEFSTKNLKMNNQAVPETAGAKKQIATFFTLHYGFFHFVYAIFLWQELPLIDLSSDDFFWLMMLVFGFIGSHGFSYRYNLQTDFKQQKPNLGTLMFYPYLRILPMHLIIIFGAETNFNSVKSVIIFMVLKTFADGAMHMIEHHLFRKKKLID